MARGVDDRARQSILQAHNTLRSLVASGGEQRGAPGPQPPASNMQILVSPLISIDEPALGSVVFLLIRFHTDRHVH